ncbi:MAG TPA: ABC-2 family transporter protein [Candidatus Bathyarchaeia archaeon]|nr:ABC-2 family transporter protein [Candidatus Bathyarchaeia archaeon]
MNKYFQVLKNTFEEYFVYRLNFFLWRVRSFALLLSLFFFWSALFSGRENLFGYQKSQILTYTLGIAVLRGIVLGNRSGDLAGVIRSGEAANMLLRPLGFFKYWFTRDLADKALNALFIIFEFWLLIALFKPPILIQTDPIYLVGFFIFCLLALILFFIINMIFGMSGFWLIDVWSVRFLFMAIFLEFLSGAFFPLDVLPPIFLKVLQFTPFPYLVYFPLKIWLGQAQSSQMILGLLVTGFWAVVFYWLLKNIWKKGLKAYDVPGR